MNTRLLAGALRDLANALETPADPSGAPPRPSDPQPETPPKPAKRGRGRPVAGEAVAAPDHPQAVEDPFTAPPQPSDPVATLDEVRASLKELAKATSQAAALKVLKDVGGADNLSGLAVEKYGAVAMAAFNALPNKPIAGTPEVDPFETTTVQVDAPSLEDVKAAVVAAQKRTSTDKVQAIVIAHGGTAPTSDGGTGPSLKALPVPKYAAVIAAVNALPSTK
jgi:hypothetical protein